jgi:hypothetical protein
MPKEYKNTLKLNMWLCVLLWGIDYLVLKLTFSLLYLGWEFNFSQEIIVQSESNIFSELLRINEWQTWIYATL